MKKGVFIIAEAGVNHNGSFKKALKLVDIAKKSKVDAIKFQTFKPGEITGMFTDKSNYIKKNYKSKLSRYEMSKKTALTYEEFRKLKKYCDKQELLFLSTPDGEESLNFLVDELKIPIIKIGSSEITNYDYLKKIAKKNKPIILSTGLSNISEVKKAYKIIRSINKKSFFLLQCTSEYPAPDNEINLNVITTFKKKFKCSVGLSDHSKGFTASIAAVALGAKIIEKHFTFDKNAEGPDHKASLGPLELLEFVKAIRNTEIQLGSSKKRITKSEKKNIFSIRRGIVAKFFLKSGTIIKKNMIEFKRPFNGIHPFDYKKVIGIKLKKNLEKDQPINLNS